MLLARAAAGLDHAQPGSVNCGSLRASKALENAIPAGGAGLRLHLACWVFAPPAGVRRRQDRGGYRALPTGMGRSPWLERMACTRPQFEPQPGSLGLAQDASRWRLASSLTRDQNRVWGSPVEHESDSL